MLLFSLELIRGIMFLTLSFPRYQSLLDFCKSLQRELLEKTKKVEEAAVLEEKDDVGEEDNVEETDKETPNIVQVRSDR